MFVIYLVLFALKKYLKNNIEIQNFPFQRITNRANVERFKINWLVSTS